MEFCFDAKVCSVSSVVSNFCGVQESFGGDTSAMQARSAEQVLLNKNHIHAELG
jgi:hypothetical protein